MGSEILRQQNQDAVPTSTPEVEFALVLSRMIDSVKTDPQQLRDTVYELARRKLQEQFASDGIEEIAPLVNALETAIRGVEEFSTKNEQSERALQKPQPHRQIAPPNAGFPPEDVIRDARPTPVVLDAWPPDVSSKSKPHRKSWSFALPWLFIPILAILVTVGIAVQHRGASLDSAPDRVSFAHSLFTTPLSRPVSEALQQPLSQSSLTIAKPSPLVPTTYGVYAVGEDKLFELEMLPGRVPDMRVAVSPVITAPSRTILPDGRVRFIVFRRDSATSAADHAEVRVMARITRATSFDAAGKPIVAAADDGWVIRNISQPYRTAPIKDNPDMYEIQSGNPESTLTPGRYVLALKGQGYDFSVAGTVTDTKQCLERLAAANGMFYSECRKP
jgi:hypothetical protein